LTKGRFLIDAAAIANITAEEVVEWAIQTFGRRLAFTTSFQSEGMVVIDMAARRSPAIRVLTLDTGRLPEETYRMIETVRSRYGVTVECVPPDSHELERMTTLHGPNLFYESVVKRRLCCEIRKVRPLERRLASFDAWVTGLRRGQGSTRESLGKVEENDSRIKISPLADWSKEQVEQYTRKFDVPRHPLYEAGYTSIGCGPCTRAPLAGEDDRAGRWWWEQDAAKECGIHFTAEGKSERTVDVLVREVTGAIRA
jgi:phosphoadenosine phosphosulfate reductase